MSKNASEVSSSCWPKAVWKMLHSTWEKNSANDLPYERMTVTTQSDGKKNSCFGKLKLLCSQETHSVIFVNSVRIPVCFHFLNCFSLPSRRKCMVAALQIFPQKKCSGVLSVFISLSLVSLVYSLVYKPLPG